MGSLILLIVGIFCLIFGSKRGLEGLVYGSVFMIVFASAFTGSAYWESRNNDLAEVYLKNQPFVVCEEDDAVGLYTDFISTDYQVTWIHEIDSYNQKLKEIRDNLKDPFVNVVTKEPSPDLKYMIIR